MLESSGKLEPITVQRTSEVLSVIMFVPPNTPPLATSHYQKALITEVALCVLTEQVCQYLFTLMCKTFIGM